MAEKKDKNNIKIENKKDETVVLNSVGKDDQGEKTTSNNENNKVKPVKTFKRNTSFKKRKTIRPKSEFDQKIIKIRRVTRVVKGGRRFSFSVAMVIGNRKGSIGVGVAKGADVALAIEKSVRKAKKDLVKLKLTPNQSIPYAVENKYCSSIVKIFPTKEGRGLSAGSSTKNVLELAGITDITAKIITRSRNKLNNAMATLQALKEFKI